MKALFMIDSEISQPILVLFCFLFATGIDKSQFYFSILKFTSVRVLVFRSCYLSQNVFCTSFLLLLNRISINRNSFKFHSKLKISYRILYLIKTRHLHSVAPNSDRKSVV